jgi:hypothetical protein
MPRTVCSALVPAALVACIAFASGAASAQVQRQFPQTALRGTLVVVAAPEVTLNDAPARLAPGARIRDAGNLLQMSASLTGARLLVHYTVDSYGLVKDVWVLSPEEAAREPWPRTAEQASNWRFDPVAQTWTRP